jgi:single-stranded-DNA-specific exonuclease
MEKEDLEEKIKNTAKKFLESIEDKEIYIVSHFDTDGITSATIMIKTLKELDKRFSVKIIKNLEKEFIDKIPKNKVILFLDLASSHLNYIKKSNFKKVFVIDHHEVSEEVPKDIEIINPELYKKQKMNAACLTYLFCKEITSKNKEIAKLGILGMIGDSMEKEIDKLNRGILEDGDIKRKRGLLIYPSTRPLNRVLEYNSYPYIPGVTGNSDKVIELLRDAGLSPTNGRYKTLIELDDNEMSSLITAIMLRNPKTKDKKLMGDIFLLKFFNKLEDGRELSAKINACSRLGRSDLAIRFCLECQKTKKETESIHTKYKRYLIEALKFASETEKIQGNGFIIINAKNKIQDTIIGTIASILQNSSLYEEGTIIITLAYYENKIKVSARRVGEGRNVKKILEKVTKAIGGEVGGHDVAAGCLINKDKENDFLNLLKRNLEIEVVKV